MQPATILCVRSVRIREHFSGFAPNLRGIKIRAQVFQVLVWPLPAQAILTLPLLWGLAAHSPGRGVRWRTARAPCAWARSRVLQSSLLFWTHSYSRTL